VELLLFSVDMCYFIYMTWPTLM